jgi:tetratricopeptide (TPR) repeat protein
MGIYLWRDSEQLALYESHCGHEVRTLSISEDSDYHFDVWETTAQVIERIATQWPPDIFLCGCPEMMPPPLAVEDCPIRTVALVSDWNMFQPQLEYNLARFDLTVLDRQGLKSLKLQGKPKRMYQPIYAHMPLVHRPLGLNRDIDILFLGNLNHAIHRERGKALESVASLADEYNVIIDAGHSQESYSQFMNRARIMINLAVRGEMNLRCYEAPACGALMFLEESNLEIRDFMDVEKDVVLYNPDNLLEKVRYYLSHEDERKQMAEHGRKKVETLAAHCRMDKLFNELWKQEPGTRTFKHFSSRQRVLADIMLYGNSHVSEQQVVVKTFIDNLMNQAPEHAVTHLAAACQACHEAFRQVEAQREDMLKTALHHFKQAAELAPKNAVCWANLSLLVQETHNPALERQCLNMVMEANSADFGGLLLGATTDPYYADWRLALALGKADLVLLHARAANRLAELALMDQSYEEALAFARKSLALQPDISTPYHGAAIALTHLGRLEEALAVFEEGLPFTAFNADYRNDQLSVLRALGLEDKAKEHARQSYLLFKASPGMEAAAEKFNSS